MRAAAAFAILVAAANCAAAEGLGNGDVTPGGSTIIMGRDPGADAAQVTVEGVYLDTVMAHVAEHFGPSATVLSETASEYVHIDLIPVPPGPDHPYWLFVTSGMSDRAMTMPPLQGATDWDRAELMIALPPDWAPDLEGFRDDARWYPLGALEYLARYPHSAATFFGPGHTIGNWQDALTIGPGTRMDSFLIDWPDALPEAACCATAPDGETIHFYMVYPLYPEELALKLDKGSDLLLERLRAAEATLVFDPARASVAQ